MKTIELLIPDGTYQRAVARAQSAGFEPRHYLSTLLIDEIERQSVSQSKKSAVDDQAEPVQLPDGIEQVLRVFECVKREGLRYNEAVAKVANAIKPPVSYSTVADKCTRKLQCSAEGFADMLSKSELLTERLCARYPKFQREIKHRITQASADQLINKPARDRMMRSLDDTETW